VPDQDQEPQGLTAEEKRAERIEKDAEALVETQERVDALAKRMPSLEGVEPSDLMPFNPTSFDAAWQLAGHVARSGMVPKELATPGAVMAVMARGVSIGLHWSVAIQVAHVVHGRVGWPADILAAVCDADPTFEYFECVETSTTHAVVEAKKHRWPEPRRYRVTLEMAKQSGYLDGKHSALWKTRPDIMLRHMAEREAARMWNQRRLAGLSDPEEVDNLPPREKNITPAPKVSTKDLDEPAPAGGGDANEEKVKRSTPSPGGGAGDDSEAPPPTLSQEAQKRIAKALGSRKLSDLTAWLVTQYGHDDLERIPASEETHVLGWLQKGDKA
jgi:hypothetical protein